MANPYVRTSPPATWPLGPGQLTDNLTGMAAGAALCLGEIDSASLAIGSTPWADVILPPWRITLGTGATGSLSRFLLFSEDNVLWPGGISPTSTSSQAAALANLLASDAAASSLALIDEITAQSGVVAYQTRWQTVYGLIGNVPRYCAVCVSNGTSVALSSTASDHSATYVVDYYA